MSSTRVLVSVIKAKDNASGGSGCLTSFRCSKNNSTRCWMLRASSGSSVFFAIGFLLELSKILLDTNVNVNLHLHYAKQARAGTWLFGGLAPPVNALRRLLWLLQPFPLQMCSSQPSSIRCATRIIASG